MSMLELEFYNFPNPVLQARGAGVHDAGPCPPPPPRTSASVACGTAAGVHDAGLLSGVACWRYVLETEGYPGAGVHDAGLLSGVACWRYVLETEGHPGAGVHDAGLLPRLPPQVEQGRRERPPPSGQPPKLMSLVTSSAEKPAIQYPRYECRGETSNTIPSLRVPRRNQQYSRRRRRLCPTNQPDRLQASLQGLLTRSIVRPRTSTRITVDFYLEPRYPLPPQPSSHAPPLYLLIRTYQSPFLRACLTPD